MESFDIDGITFIRPTFLYNLLQQGLDYPNLSDPNFLLLLDARDKAAYNESHIITAKKAPQDKDSWSMLPFDSEIECRVNIVVYDSNTSVENQIKGPSISCAKFLWKIGSRNQIQVLDGGYEVFSALYPFLRTQKIIYMPRELEAIETYPAEIVPGMLYLGNRFHGNAPHIQKDLKIKAHINCCIEPGELFNETGANLMHIPLEDKFETDISPHFKPAISFIGTNVGAKRPVLVYSDKGISRSAAIVMAYMIFIQANSLKAAYKFVKECSWKVRPNRGFVAQLSQYEAQSYGAPITDISDPNF